MDYYSVNYQLSASIYYNYLPIFVVNGSLQFAQGTQRITRIMVYGFNKQPGGSLLGYSYLIAILVIKKKKKKKKKIAKHFIIGRGKNHNTS